MKYLFPSGDENPRWMGGRRHAQGYVFVKRPEHPNANRMGYVREHVLVVSEHLGRKIEAHEVVHHKNGIRDDNRLENLAVMARRNHTSLHTRGNVAPASLANLATMTSEMAKEVWSTTRAHQRRKPRICAGCGVEYLTKQPQARTKYCDHACYVRHRFHVAAP